MEFYNQSFNESLPSNDTPAEEVPLFVTYINMVVILLVATVIIYTAAIVINVIWQIRELHTKYYFFVANLLATDIASITMQSVLQYLIMIIYLLNVNSNSTAIALKWSALLMRTILHLMTIALPITLAAERMIVIGFPYRHRSIMTTKTAARILVVMWVLSIVVAIAIIAIVPVEIVWPLGLVDWDGTYLPFILTFRLISAIFIIAANVFLLYKVVMSNRKAKENERLGNEQEATRFQKQGKLLRKHAKPTITLLLVGGVDVIANMLILLVYVAVSVSVEPNTKVYIEQFFLHPLRSSLLLSHPLIYGLYMKKIRNRLPMCTVCQGRLVWNTRHSRVTSLRHRS